MVPYDRCFHVTRAKNDKQNPYVPGEPATCILCCKALVGGDNLDEVGCPKCPDYTACGGCNEKIQNMHADNYKSLDLCPCCHQDSKPVVRYQDCMHATGVEYVERGPEPETCYLCIHRLGNSREGDITCPTCNIFVAHRGCWDKQKRANVRDGLPENQCHCCGTAIEMSVYHALALVVRVNT